MSGESWRERFDSLARSMVGRRLEVHCKDGCVYSGVFDAADVDNDFEIILKMASVVKKDTSRGFELNPCIKTLGIMADKIVQVAFQDSVSTVQSENSVEPSHDHLGSEFEVLDKDSSNTGDTIVQDFSVSTESENSVERSGTENLVEHSRKRYVFVFDRELKVWENNHEELDLLAKTVQKLTLLTDGNQVEEGQNRLMLLTDGKQFEEGLTDEDQSVNKDRECKIRGDRDLKLIKGEKELVNERDIRKSVEDVLAEKNDFIKYLEDKLLEKDSEIGTLKGKCGNLELKLTDTKKELNMIKDKVKRLEAHCDVYENKWIEADRSSRKLEADLKESERLADFFLGEIKNMEAPQQFIPAQVLAQEETLTRGEYNDLRAKVAAESSLAVNADAVAIVMPDTEFVPLNLNPFEKCERSLQKTGTWLVEHIFFARVLILLSAFAGFGIVACLTTMKEASTLKKWLMGVFGGLLSVGIPWLVERYQNKMLDLLRDMKTKFPSVENLLFSFAYVAICFGFVKLSDFVEQNEWTWVAVVFYCLCYIYVTSLMKVLGKSDVFGTGDALITISCMLMVKLHKEGKVNTLSLIGYLFGAVLLVLFRMGKKKETGVKKE